MAVTSGSVASALSFQAIDHVDAIDRESFQRSYLQPRRPVVMTQFAKDWPAMSRWTPEFFQSNYGDIKIKVYDAKFAEPGSAYMSNIGEMRFGDYLHRVLTEDADLRMFLYNLAAEIPELKADVILPKLADGFSKHFMFMFFGCRGSVTPIHYDIDMSHVFHTAIYGRKRFTLFPPDDSTRLYQHPFTVRSYVDVDNPDLLRFPRVAEAQGYQVVLEPGETIFIPCGYWHHVSYVEGGYAISLRCSNERPLEWLQGWMNLLLVSPIDRIMNKLFPGRWFQWKESRASKLAESLH